MSPVIAISLMSFTVLVDLVHGLFLNWSEAIMRGGLFKEEFYFRIIELPISSLVILIMLHRKVV